MASNNGGVPPGFRFHPTDEELLHYYLRKKVSFQKFDLEVIREVDLNKLEPWDLQERCRIGSTPQNEWYFFSHKDRKYPTGSRTNRATNAGFWKATGRDKCIRNSFKKIGMRKTLVFYRGRAPHGQKTDWIMHEYRLEDSNDPANSNEDGWVVCRVFTKKNLFKLGEGSSSSTSMSALTQQLNHHTSNNNQPSRNNNIITTTHQYLHSHQHNQTSFDLYKPKLALHHYSHIPDSHRHHHYQPQANLLPQLLSDHQRDCDDGSESLAGAQVQQYQACHEAAAAAAGLELGSCEEASAATQQLMVEARDHQEGLNDWAMLDRLVTPVVSNLGHDEDNSAKGAVRFVNGDANAHQHLSLRGEMDFWGYGK